MKKSCTLWRTDGKGGTKKYGRVLKTMAGVCSGLWPDSRVAKVGGCMDKVMGCHLGGGGSVCDFK